MRNQLLDFRINRFILYITAIFSLLLGIVVLYGWLTLNAILLQVDIKDPPMQANSAFCFILSGLSIIFLLNSRRMLSILCGGAIVVFATLILIEYLFQVSLGIDQLFVPYHLTYYMVYPGRSAPNTAVCFLLLGLSLMATNLRLTNMRSFLVEFMTGVTGSIGIITFFGYLFGLYSITGWVNYSAMPIHSAIGLIVLSVGLFMAHTIYSFYREKNFYGPVVGVIFLTIYITILLWQGFQTYQNLTARALSENNADFMASSIKTDLEDISEASNRMIQRWKFKGDFDPGLWKIDTANFLKDFEGIENMSWYDSQFNLKENAVPESELPKSLFSGVFAQIQLEEHADKIFHKLEGNYLYLFDPLYSSEKVLQGVLVTKINMVTLLEYSIPSFLENYYDIDIVDKNTNFYQSVQDNGAISSVESPFLEWYIHIVPKKDSSITSFIPILILVSGLMFITFILASSYMLRQVFRAKERVLVALKDRENALAFRQAILDGSNYSIIAVDKNGIIQSFNKAAERMLQWKHSDMIYKQTAALFHDPNEIEKRSKELTSLLGEKIEPGFDVFTAMAKRDRPEELEWTYIRKDGTRSPYIFRYLL